MLNHYRKITSVFIYMSSICLFSVMLFLGGCKSFTETSSSPKGTQTETDSAKKEDNQPNPDAETIDGERVTNNGTKSCSNPYYPINTNVERSYKIGGTGKASYALKQTQDEDDTFSEKRTFDSGTDVVINWSCTPDGLRNAEFTNSISMPKGMAKMKTLASSGITLPKVWEKGKKFEAKYNISMSLSIAGASASSKGTVTIQSEIIGIDENVSVQGGDFVAAKVASVIKMNLTVNGRKVPSRDIKMTNWYSPKIGLIKQETKSQFGAANVEYTGER